ncbi:MAG: D-alanyl-D-alanine carboxypeptidase [Bacteroidales bacterium]|nr:D-alanyl-D-alanine carboxypeptidase [Bacteroidales bacterium]
MQLHTKYTIGTFVVTMAVFAAIFLCKLFLPTMKAVRPDYSCDQVVAERLQRLVERNLDSLGTSSIYVYDMTVDSVLFSYDADKALTPASCQKIITTFAAYDHLSDYNNAFSDSLMAVGEITPAGYLKGHLFLRGSYDPLLQDFSSFAKALKKKGLKIVYGDLVCQLRVHQKFENRDIPYESLPVLYKGADAVAMDLRNQLAKLDIYVTGRTMFLNYDSKLPFDLNAKLADGAPQTTLLHAESHSLEEIMSHLMQHSDNRSAEAVFCCLGANDGHGGSGSGADICRKSLKKFFPGLTEKQCHIVDGSGLSYDNRVSARVLVDLLRVAHNYGLLGHFLVDEAMPKSGASGTLRNRMKGTAAEGNICAKTGTLPQYPASSLAGYCQSTRGHLLAFAIISNGPKNRAGNAYIHRAKLFENEFCIEMCR